GPITRDQRRTVYQCPSPNDSDRYMIPEEVRQETGRHYWSAAKCLVRGLTAFTWRYRPVTGNCEKWPRTSNLTFAVGGVIDRQVIYFQSGCFKSLHYSFSCLSP